MLQLTCSVSSTVITLIQISKYGSRAQHCVLCRAYAQAIDQLHTCPETSCLTNCQDKELFVPASVTHVCIVDFRILLALCRTWAVLHVCMHHVSEGSKVWS